jgi:hypothetical protein
VQTDAIVLAKETLDARQPDHSASTVAGIAVIHARCPLVHADETADTHGCPKVSATRVERDDDMVVECLGEMLKKAVVQFLDITIQKDVRHSSAVVFSDYDLGSVRCRCTKHRQRSDGG